MNTTAEALTGNTGAMSAADLSSHTELGGTLGTVTVENPRMRCSQVDVFYGDKQAIKKVSLDIGNNEVIAMIGAQRPQAALAQRGPGQAPFEAGEQ